MKKLIALAILVPFFNNAMENVGQEALQAGSIMATSIVATSLYGILNNQVTVRICPEFFTQGFMRQRMYHWNGPVLRRARNIIMNTESPTVIGLVWGPIATWWVGALLGIPVALAARVGSHNQISATELIKPLAIALAATGTGAAVVGGIGYVTAWDLKFREKFISRFPAAVAGVPATAMRGFITNAYAHQAAYAAGALSGLSVIGYILNKRLAH